MRKSRSFRFRIKKLIWVGIVFVVSAGGAIFALTYWGSKEVDSAVCCTSCGSNCTREVCANGNYCCCEPHCPGGYSGSGSGSKITISCSCCGNSKDCYKNCTPGCSCTPDCPGSSTHTYSGPLCETREKCTCTDGCGDTHTKHGDDCWYPETNSDPATPDRIYVCTSSGGGVSLASCINVTAGTEGITKDNPKRIVLPAAGSVFTVALSEVTVAGARDLQYWIGTDYGYDTWTGCGGASSPNDNCYGWNSSNSTSDLRNSIGLAYGAKYHVWGAARSLNKCDDNWRQSANVEGYFVINHPPVVISVDPSSGITGTETDELDQVVCDDNNPRTYTFEFIDKDGCDDIETTAFWFGETNHPEVYLLDESVHGIVRDANWDGEYGMVGWRCDTGSHQVCNDGRTGCDCYKNYVWSVPSVDGLAVNGSTSADPTLCSPSEGSYDDKTNCSPTNTPGGWHADSITCAYNPYAGYDVLTLKVRVWIYDDIGDNLNIFGFVQDKLGERNGGAAGSSNWDDIGDRLLDMTPPTAEVTSIYHDYDSNSDTLVFDQSVSDTGNDASGLRSMYDRYYWITRDGAEIQCDIGEQNCTSVDGDEIDLTSPHQFSYTRSDERSGFRGGDDVSASVSSSDKACNISGTPVPYELPDPPDTPWMITRFNAVYSQLGYHDSIQRLEDPRIPMSTQWIGANTSAASNWSFNVGRASSGEWISRNYNDMNRWGVGTESWYGTLYGLARRSDWAALPGNDIQSIDGSPSLTLSTLVEGIYEYTDSDDLIISGNCNNEQVIFVRDADVYITPDVGFTDPNTDACLLITRDGNIHITGGADVPDDSEDAVKMAFVTDSTFITDEDLAFDKLRITGFVFARNTDFRRDLVFEDNLSYPAEIIDYDPRYLWLRDKLGRRPFEWFECGAIEDSPACDGWPKAK